MKIFRLLFLVAVAFAADESTDEEKSACENETSIIQATPEYQASYELVVQGIEEIDNTCVKDGGWFIWFVPFLYACLLVPSFRKSAYH